MTADALRTVAYGCAALVVASGAAFPAVAAGGQPSAGAVADGALVALAPALGLVVVTRQARGRRLSSWAALVGSLLTLALGLALYAAALQGTRLGAADLAVSFVSIRQLVAVAVTAWAVWVTRGAV